MLHRGAARVMVAICAAPLLAAAVPDGGLGEGRLHDVLTFRARAALGGVIGARVVALRRKMPRADGVIVPGGRGLQGLGWVLARGRVLTAAALVAGWPETDGDRIEIGAGGTWRVAGVGLSDGRLGVAVLDVPGLPAPAIPVAAPGANALWIGRSVYTVASPGGRLLRAVITGRGEGAEAYFWRAVGDPLPVGAPVFGADGAPVALVGRDPGRDRATALLLPPRALRGVFDRVEEWRP